MSKIGVGVTTTDPEKYMKYLKVWNGLILFNTDQNTIAKDKNKLIKQLYNLGCTDIFLFDDDCFPVNEGWTEWIIGKAAHHAVLGEQIPGCMLYLTREVIEKVGYINTAYGKYGWEHLGYFNRIEKAIVLNISILDGWEEYIYSYDLQGANYGFEKTEWQTQDEKDKRSQENLAIFKQETESDKIYYAYDEPVAKKQREGKLQVLYMYPYDDPIFYYRLAVLKYINNRDIEITRRPYEGNITWATLQQYDVLILERPSGVQDLNMIKLAKQVKVKVITDWDDDCLNVDEYNPMYATFQSCKEIIMESLYLSDEVWVATETLKKSFSLFNRNITVVPNAHNDHLFPVSQKKSFDPKKKKAVWRGGQSHEADVYSHSKELVRIINKNKKWSFFFLGDRFIGLQLQCGGNYQPVSMMPLMQYMETLYQANPQIVFHPLRDTLFNKSKSNIAYIEASYSGAAFFGNTNLPEFDVPGALSFNYIGEYFKNTEALKIANEESWTYIKNNLLLSQVNELRAERLLNI